MQYVLLIYGEEVVNPPARQPSDEERAQQMAAWDAFTKEVKERGVFRAGEALQSVQTATTVRIRDGRTLITDGPFAETKEGLGGFYLLDCRDLDEALEFAAKCPGALFGSMEVRPVWEYAAEDAGAQGAMTGTRAGG